MIVAREQPERRIFLGGVSWETYQSLRGAEENANLRMTYDRGAMEIVSPSRKHEHISCLVGRMIDQWTLLHKIGVAAGRNTTFGRRDLDRGLEPDNCYWITHEELMRACVLTHLPIWSWKSILRVLQFPSCRSTPPWACPKFGIGNSTISKSCG